jgi:rubrerythrin
MADLKGTKTEKNLREAFAGESQARNKYTFYASMAKKEGYEQVAAIFLETAENEKEHAKLHFQALHGIGDTIANLKAAAAGEGEETKSMYPRMAQEARAEGFEEIAKVFEGVGAIERAHQQRYEFLLKSIQDGAVFKKGKAVAWRCRNCGHIHTGVEAPERCPVCKHPRAYFEVMTPLA